MSHLGQLIPTMLRPTGSTWNPEELLQLAKPQLDLHTIVFFRIAEVRHAFAVALPKGFVVKRHCHPGAGAEGAGAEMLSCLAGKLKAFIGKTHYPKGSKGPFQTDTELVLVPGGDRVLSEGETPHGFTAEEHSILLVEGGSASVADVLAHMSNGYFPEE